MKEKESTFSFLITRLKQDSIIDEATQLDFLLRDVAWTTGSEFLEEFGKKMIKIKATQWDRMHIKTQQAFRRTAEDVLKVWPEIGL